MFFLRNKKFKGTLTPDEVFLDSENIPGYVRERLEGIIEKPLGKTAVYFFAALVTFIGGLFLFRVSWLQIVRGQEFAARSQYNYIRKTYIEPPRGIIYDRNGEPIITNAGYEKGDGTLGYHRVASHPYAFSHVLGFVGQFTSEDEFHEGFQEIGRSGIERFYNAVLAGRPGEQDEELDAKSNIVSRGPQKPPQKGEDLALTIDAGLQEALWSKVDSTVKERGFGGGAGIIFSLKDGSILSLVSVPSFDLNAFSRGLSNEQANAIFNDTRAPLFNRALSGTYSPGSVIKPFYALAALEESVIDPARQIFSSGALSLPDPYRPGQFSVFKDWKAHGYVDMRKALAVSSNVYFFTVGGGFGDIKGLGISRINNWLRRFEFDKAPAIDLAGEIAGHLPDPSKRVWRVGDTYNVSIGQGDVLVSPIAMARALGLLAGNGSMPNFHLLKGAPIEIVPAEFKAGEANLKVVREGMKMAVENGGTGAALAWLPFEAAGKTGTAEVGKKDRVNSWFIGYLPYENPEMGMVIFLESGPRSNLVGASFVASETFRWIIDHGGVEKLLNPSN